jgi:hypothetical protein
VINVCKKTVEGSDQYEVQIKTKAEAIDTVFIGIIRRRLDPLSRTVREAHSLALDGQEIGLDDPNPPIPLTKVSDPEWSRLTLEMIFHIRNQAAKRLVMDAIEEARQQEKDQRA